MVEYDAGVVIEDLVQLLHKRRDAPRDPPLKFPRIKHIHFASPSEIPSLLASKFMTTCSELRVDVPTPVSRAGYIFQTERTEDEENIQPEEPDVEPADEVYEELEPQGPVLAPDEPALICGHKPTEEELSAVKRIQATYRTYRKHRDAQARATGSGLKAQRNAIFVACLKNVYTSNWGRTSYRTLYLWALPRLVVCLDRAVAIAQEAKGKIKSQLSIESYVRLEELAKQANKIK